MRKVKRKAKPAGKRYPLNMRTTRELREQVEAAAHTSGRSLVQEVEHRLEHSFAIERQEKALDASMRTVISLHNSIMKIISDRLPAPPPPISITDYQAWRQSVKTN